MEWKKLPDLNPADHLALSRTARHNSAVLLRGQVDRSVNLAIDVILHVNFFHISTNSMIISSHRFSGTLFPAAGFAAYTAWLLAFPMKGPLLQDQADNSLLLAYLLPHILMLLAMACVRQPAVLERWWDAGLGLTMASTLAFPVLSPDYASAIMILSGLSSALVMLKVGSVLKNSANPFQSAASGLVLGNVVLVLIHQASPKPLVLAIFLAGLLALLLQKAASSEPTRVPELYPCLPFIYVYYLISGLKYEVLQSDYSMLALAPGFDLPCYVLAVVSAYALFHKNRDLLLVLGILFGMLSLSFGTFPAPAATSLSMICMQASVGFVDVFYVCLLLQQSNAVRSFGLGIAVMCLGIASGEALAGHLLGMEDVITVVGNGALTLAVLILFMLGRTQGRNQASLLTSFSDREHHRTGPGGPEIDSTVLDCLPLGIRSRLSPREKNVLAMAVTGLHYKEIALEMDISESSVKTYMRRVFEKTGVSGKQELMDRHFPGHCT
jgi:DNA-binding CsgD family transcriptional regulator